MHTWRLLKPSSDTSDHKMVDKSTTATVHNKLPFKVRLIRDRVPTYITNKILGKKILFLFISFCTSYEGYKLVIYKI